ncbi:uncharacterized protein LOC143448946 [Clavelina lepadiformis]|uniref:uncharacterized protein LOC143448946 n=1 Tax=Clavelina lepadiformis TaxID=159417 RepID=UPI004041C10C
MRTNHVVESEIILKAMAPKLATVPTSILADEQCLVQKQNIDCNHNELEKRLTTAQKRPANGGDVNERSRKLIKSCFSHLHTNLNVLVVGSSGSGKSSLINSMNMALTQEWKDRAKYCPGRKHVIDECVMYNNRKAGGKVVFWDTRGFEEIHADDHAILILRYVLEGRIPAKCIPCVLLMSKEKIKKRYHKIVEAHRRIDLVLNVSALDQEPQTRLMTLVEQAISTSKHVSVNKIPTLSVATKSDVLSEKEMVDKLARLHEYSLQHLVSERRTLGNSNRRARLPSMPEVGPIPKVVINYSCELEPWSDESMNPSLVKPSPDRDTQLLSLWREIVSRTAPCGGADRRKRAYSATASSRPMCRCLPFRIDYSRLRSASF